MLIPQFSLRWLLGLTTVCAVVFSIVGLAVRGSEWAAAVSIGIGSLVVLILVYGLVFVAVWIFSVIVTSFRRRRGGPTASPFQSGLPAATAEEAPAAPVLMNESPVDPEQP